jgi:hypothetical protein
MPRRSSTIPPTIPAAAPTAADAIGSTTDFPAVLPASPTERATPLAPWATVWTAPFDGRCRRELPLPRCDRCAADLVLDASFTLPFDRAERAALERDDRAVRLDELPDDFCERPLDLVRARVVVAISSPSSTILCVKPRGRFRRLPFVKPLYPVLRAVHLLVACINAWPTACNADGERGGVSDDQLGYEDCEKAFGRSTGRASERLGLESEAEVGIGTSICLIAVGAILKYAVTGHVSGVDLDTVGIILMIAGVIGLVLSLLWTMIWADRIRDDRTVVTEPAPRRRVVDRDVY